MVLSQETKTLLSEINKASGNRLQRSMDLARLMELAYQSKKQSVLDDLAFRAKFLTKTFELMKRIGKGGEGYDKLLAEFSANVEKVQQHIRTLLETSTKEMQAHFSATYLSLGDMTMENLMPLLHDLSWYKNYHLDARHES
ncbi:MAG: hypothetical protein PHP42_11545 [Bacteroidota bacterium]|nr:hypothetical protein [Bacteroidota bacterium]